MAGLVLNRADQPLPSSRYDLLVIGAGVLGLACAYYLRRLLPDASVLIVEQGGVPSEEGASYVSPAVVGCLGAEPAGGGEAAEAARAWRRRAAWSLGVLADPQAALASTRPEGVFRPVGWCRFETAGVGGPEGRDGPDADGFTVLPTARFLADLPRARRRALEALVDLGGLDRCLFDERGGYGSAEALALHYGYAAVGAGATLLLNTRVNPFDPHAVTLERLAYTRTMSTEVVARQRVEAALVVVAAGAGAAELIESGLGLVEAVPRAFRQYPRLERDARLPLVGGRVDLPVVEVAGVTLRPQGEGLLVIPPPQGADPAGYRPVGGRVMGVTVGVRREILDALLNRADRLPLLDWPGFNLGKTVSRVRGAWQALTPSGLPRVEPLAGGAWWLVLGGRHGFALAPALGYELAARVAGRSDRPWS